MKKVSCKVKRIISVLMAAAMIVTCVPQTGLSVRAEEDTQVDDLNAASTESEEQDDFLSDVDGSENQGKVKQEVQSEVKSEIQSEDTVYLDTENSDADIIVFNEDNDGTVSETTYTVTTHANTDQVTVDAAESVQDNTEYIFTVAAKEGYEVKDVKVYKTAEYESYQADPENQEVPAAVQTSEEATEPEGTTKYTIAAGSIKEAVTIVVTSDAIETEPSVYQIKVEADAAQAVVEAQTGVQENTAYSFTVAAKEGYEIKDVKIYNTAEYEVYQADPENQEVPVAIQASEEATEPEGTIKYTIEAGNIKESVTIVVTSAEKVVEPAVYQVTTEADTEQVVVEAAAAVQENTEYSFMVSAKDGYGIKDVKVYKTAEYETYKNAPESQTVPTPIQITEEAAGTEGKIKYMIAAGDVSEAITIVIVSEAQIIEPEECKVMVEYPGLYVSGIMYAVGDSDKFLRYSTLGIKAYKGQKLQIKISQVKRGYVAYILTTDGKKEYIGSDGIYTMIPSVDNETVKIETEGEGNKRFKVSYEIIGANSDEKENININFSGAVTETTEQGEQFYSVYANYVFSMGVRINPRLPEGRRIKNISYQTGTYEESFELSASQRQSGGSFRIPANKVTGDMKFIIELEDTPKYKITFDYDIERVEIRDLPRGLFLEETNYVEVLDGSNAAQKFGFKPVMTNKGEKFEVKEVTADGVILMPGEETGKYFLRMIDKSVNIKVSIQLNKNMCNNLVLAADGHEDAFSAVITGFVEGDDAYENGSMELEAGERALTQADMLHVSVRAKENYQIDQVKLDDEVLQPVSETDGKKNYDISFLDKMRIKRLTVSASPVPTDAAKTVIFSRTQENNSAKIEVEETQNIVKMSENIYELKKGATYFDFAVTMESSEYEPEVLYKNEDSADSGTKIDFRNRDGNVYHYSIAAGRLPEQASIVVDRNLVEQTMKISYDDSEVLIESVRVGSKQIEGIRERGGMSYQIPRGNLVSVRVSAQDNCQIISANTTMEGETKKETVSASGFTFYVTADADSVTEIESRGFYVAKPLQEAGGRELVPSNGIYQVSCYKAYRGGALYGTTDAYHSRIEVKVGGKVVSDDDESTGIEIQDESTAFYLALTDQVAGKTLEVNLFDIEWDEEGNEKEIPMVSYKLKVGPAVSSISLDGVSSDSKLEQPLNTTVSYKINSNPAAADLSVVNLDVEGDTSSISAELTDGFLQITTGETEGKEAQIKLYMNDDSDSGEKILKQFTVTTVKQLSKKIPKVELKLAGDTSLKLAVSAPEDIVKPTVGKFYYKVTAEPKDGTGKPDKVKADTQYVEKTDEDVQTVKLIVSDEKEGHGQPWEFNVSVEFIQTREDLLTDGSNEAQAGIDRTLVCKDTFSTRKAYYEDKLKLKKAKTTVFTGQKNIVVATAQFGKNTTFTEITARDITYPDNPERALQVDTDDEGRVIVSALAEEDYYNLDNTITGKHRIEVTAYSTESMYASRATIDVTVVRGIDFLRLDVPTASLYKADKKAASIKVTPMLNHGNSDHIPKSKKLTWEIVDLDGNALTSGSPLYGMVTVKNGTVTVNKNYKVSSTKENNQFKVKATAADYPGSRVTAYSEILTITGEKMEIGDIAILRYTENGMEVVARNEKKVPEVEAQEIQGAEIAAFYEGVPVKDIYTFDEYDQYVIRNNISYKSSNAKSVYVDAIDGSIEVHNPAKKVKLSAIAEDGSKSKKELIITVTYDSAEKLGVRIERYNVNEYNWNHFSDPDLEKGKNSRTLYFTDTSMTRFRLELKRWILYDGQEEEGYWDAITPCTNYKLDVKGAKVLERYSDSAEIVANSAETVITVTEKNTGSKTEYKLINKGFPSSAGVTPKVTIGGIVASDYGVIQETTGQFKDSGISDYNDNEYFAKIEIDWTAANKKNMDDLWILEYQMDPRGYFPLESDGSFRLRFCVPGEDYSYLKAGNYKMKASLGQINEEGEFVPVCKEASAVLKITKQKTASFKMTTSYTISPKDSTSVPLTGKGNYSEVYYENLQNANVNGVENKFCDYFELADGRLQLKEGYDHEKEPEKKDLIGYVTYTAAVFAPNAPEWDGPYWAHSVTGTVKITVKWKQNNIVKYAVSDGNIYPDENSLTVLTATANKKPVDIAYAVVDKNDQSEWEVTDTIASHITIKSLNKKNENSKNPITLWIVPAESYYKSQIDTITGQIDNTSQEEKKNELEDEREKLIKQSGINVKCKVTVKGRETGGKITIAKNALKQTFQREQYDSEHGNYWLHVPYTRAFADAEIESIDIMPKDTLVKAGWFSEDNVDYIDIIVNKKELADAVAAGNNLNYGGEVRIQSTINYRDCEVKDTFNFTLTLPEKADFDSYEKAVAAIEKEKDNISKEITVGYWKGISEEEWINEQNNARWQLWDMIYKMAGNDSNINFDSGVNGEKIDEIMPVLSAKRPESQKNGEIVIEAKLRNIPLITEGEPRPEETVTSVIFTLTVNATGTEPADVQTVIESFVNSRPSDYASNDMKYEDLCGDLREYIKMHKDDAIDISNLRFDIWIQELEGSEEDYGGWKHATQNEEGYISGYMHAYDIRYGADEIKIPFKFVIAKLKL